VGRFTIAAVVVLVEFLMSAGMSVAQAQANLSPVEQAGRLIADMQDCAIDKSTANLVTRKLSDWVRHTQRNDNALTCTRDPACTGLTPEITTAYICARVPCTSTPPAKRPDCNTFVPRLKAMRLLRDDWQPRDGLK